MIPIIVTLRLEASEALTALASAVAARLMQPPPDAPGMADLLQGVKDIRNLLSRMGWNALAAHKRACAQAEETAPPGSAPAPAPARQAAPAEIRAEANPAVVSGPPAAAPRAKPAAEGAQAASTRGWATPERKALLRTAWPAGVMIGPLRQQLAELPGPPLPNNSAIASMASVMLLRRPDGFGRMLAVATMVQRAAAPSRREPADANQVEIVRSTARPAPLPPRRPPPAAARAPGGGWASDAPSVAALELAEQARASEVAQVTISDALAWGRYNGVSPLRHEIERHTLKRINNKRGDMGLPPFTIVPQRGLAHDPLPAPHVISHEGAAA